MKEQKCKFRGKVLEKGENCEYDGKVMCEACFESLTSVCRHCGESNDSADHLLCIANSPNERMYMKHDGSIEDGFEMVTHPISLDDHKKKMPWEKVYDKAKKGNMGRYVCVNLQNYNTIEFRIFRGTLKYETFIATLELVHEICNRAIDATDYAFETMCWSDFVK